MTGSVRAYDVSTVLAVPLLMPGSLVVTVSFSAAAYPRAVDDVGCAMAKAADDRMSLMVADRLRERGICCLSVWPGLAKLVLSGPAVPAAAARRAGCPCPCQLPGIGPAPLRPPALP